jgi:hypothetical protein
MIPTMDDASAAVSYDYYLDKDEGFLTYVP